MAAKKDEMKIDVPLDNVKAKLQLARVMLQEENLSKTGKNDFAHFDFFQLEDFLPQINKIFAKLGLHSEFNITTEIVAFEEKSIVCVENGNLISITKTPILKEMATLVITDVLKPDDVEVYEMETAPVMIGNNTKQNIYQAAGGRNTYYKRYLYMNALEIVEKDESDTVLGQPNVNYQQPNITPYAFMPQLQVQKPMTQLTSEQPKFEPDSTQPIKVTTEQGDWTPQQVDNNVYATTDSGVPMGIPTTNLNQVAETIEQATEQTTNEQAPLSTESKMEIMGLVNQKGLNGATIIGDFCKQNGLKGPHDLLEIHKQPLLDMINGMN